MRKTSNSLAQGERIVKRSIHNSKPLVSIILPVYNGEKYIGFAIDSLLGQTYRNLEIIIIDDASLDDTKKIVRTYKDKRIRLVRLSANKGPAHARNVGMRLARGQWIGFIDSDDCWDKERLSKLLEIAGHYKNICVASDVLVCLSGPGGELIPIRSVCRDQKRNKKIFSYESMLDFARSGFDLKPLCPISLLKKFRIEFNENEIGTEWREFIFRLLALGLSIIVLNQALYKYRVTSRSLSSSYNYVKNEIKTTEHLIRFPWIDKETKNVLLKGQREIRKRLLSTALREKKWKEALIHATRFPGSLVFLVGRTPQYLKERYKAKYSKP